MKLIRKATASDMIEGNNLLLHGDDEIHEIVISEVLHPDDEWKAICADDGCRYGLNSLYVPIFNKKESGPIVLGDIINPDVLPHLKEITKELEKQIYLKGKMD